MECRGEVLSGASRESPEWSVEETSLASGGRGWRTGLGGVELERGHHRGLNRTFDCCRYSSWAFSHHDCSISTPHADSVFLISRAVQAERIVHVCVGKRRARVSLLCCMCKWSSSSASSSTSSSRQHHRHHPSTLRFWGRRIGRTSFLRPPLIAPSTYHDLKAF